MNNSSLFKSLGKIGVFALWGVAIATLYYKTGLHSESLTNAWQIYTGAFGVYAIYKGLSVLTGKYENTIGLPMVFAWFLAILFTLCLIFLGGAGIILFSKIIGYLFLPLGILYILGNFGLFVFSKLDSTFSNRSTGYQFVLPMAFGFSAFLFILSILVSTGVFTLWSVFGTLALLGAISYAQFPVSAKAIWNLRFTLGKEAISSYTLLSEGFFIILAILLSANFIHIVRPMPIGWDDLGVYMNFPRMLAENAGLSNVGIIAGQTFTAIGFLFRSAPQAFFLNQVGGILSTLFIIAGIGSLLHISFGSNSDKNRLFAPLPLIAATMFMAMPMVVFEQAKDMKLDPMLFSISIASLIGIYELLSKKDIRGKNLYFTVAAIWVIVGAAFALKATSLMLIIAIAGLFFYEYIGLLGFFGFFSVFVGFFTKFKLWGNMNVVYPSDNETLLTIFGFGGMILGVLLIIGGIFTHFKKEEIVHSLKHALIIALCFGGGALVFMSPWLIKNAYELRASGVHIDSIGLLNGTSKTYTVDYETFRPDYKEISAKKAAEQVAAAESGTTLNEDFGRYFGYEEWINNHLKLPYNLSMQKNQSGEYTDISYIFLALLPALFLFLPFRNILGVTSVLLWLGFWASYFLIPGIQGLIESFFGTFKLPIGYIPLTLLTFTPLLWAHFLLKRESEGTKLFLRNLAFLSLYGFIFVIAAFGVVWYGIALYFGFLVAIMVTLSYSNSGNTDEDEWVIHFIIVGTTLAIIAIYLLRSAVPHAWNNISGSGFEEFKNGRLSQEEAIFAYHSDYLNILATLNRKDGADLVKKIVTNTPSSILKTILTNNSGALVQASDLSAFLQKIESISEADKTGLAGTDLLTLKKSAKEMRLSLYDTILYPDAADRNMGPIYRIGTFLTYFISNNRSRYFDDSLVENFYSYFYDSDPEKTVDRIVKSGLKYFLVDLNAATIDRDPRHNLTTRYESLLATFPSKKLKLIQTDSLCLRVGLEELKNGKISADDYKFLAWVNYDSYGKTAEWLEGAISRTKKLETCEQYISNIIKTGRVDGSHFTYLLPIAEYVKKNNITKDSAILNIVAKSVDHGWLALFEVQG